MEINVENFNKICYNMMAKLYPYFVLYQRHRKCGDHHER